MNGATANTRVGIGTIQPDAMLHISTGDSNVYGLHITGHSNVSGVAPVVLGTNLFFLPGKSAFRAGYVDGSSFWSGNNVGSFSAAFGYNTVAKGDRSFAAGDRANANGGYCIALGISVVANGGYCIALGDGTTANGTSSTSMGRDTRAEGNSSLSAGNSNVAKGYSSTVVGMYNDSLLTENEATGSSPATPLFIVGNGDGFFSRSNALTVFKNGNVATENLQTGGGTVFSKQQAGTYAAGASATQLKQLTFSFPTAFASMPKIIITARGEPGTSNNDVYLVTVRNITASSVTVNVFRADTAAGWGQNLQLDWFAWE